MLLKDNRVFDSGTIICVYDTEQDQLMQLDLEEYIVGVVAAEMPAAFETEALKAQAVAARTFAVNRMMHTPANVTALHAEAHITTSPETCQAWINETTQKERWGSSYTKWQDKIRQAVTETAGEVLYYNDALIEPVYHASCGGGYTEDAEAVWGSARPYLISVACNHPADAHSNEVTVIGLQEFSQKLHLPDTVAAGVITGRDSYIEVKQKTASGRIKEVRIGETVCRGGTLRSALGLKSLLLDWNIQNGNIVFTTSGYGHGVGMCQHGANYYAKQGNDYRWILKHYYSGAEVGSYQR